MRNKRSTSKYKADNKFTILNPKEVLQCTFFNLEGEM